MWKGEGEEKEDGRAENGRMTGKVLDSVNRDAKKGGNFLLKVIKPLPIKKTKSLGT